MRSKEEREMKHWGLRTKNIAYSINVIKALLIRSPSGDATANSFDHLIIILLHETLYDWVSKWFTQKGNLRMFMTLKAKAKVAHRATRAERERKSWEFLSLLNVSFPCFVFSFSSFNFHCLLCFDSPSWRAKKNGTWNEDDISYQNMRKFKFLFSHERQFCLWIADTSSKLSFSLVLWRNVELAQNLQRAQFSLSSKAANEMNFVSIMNFQQQRILFNDLFCW